jgi:phosphopantothenoylcysteine decarboxylase/phosphopantothenate--cysteine ligase
VTTAVAPKRVAGRTVPAPRQRPETRPSPAPARRGRPWRVLVTAGPTREHIDPVRFLSNESSGRMGFEIAREAAERGWRVTLVAGPVALPTPAGVTRVNVISAREMLDAASRAFGDADALFMAAAVSDWRPRQRRAQKWRKKEQGGTEAQLDLVRTPDILARLAHRKGGRLVVGFALETADGERRARRKLVAKNADYMVLNDDSALNAERATVTILGRDGTSRRLENRSKAAIARALVGLAAPRGDGR